MKKKKDEEPVRKNTRPETHEKELEKKKEESKRDDSKHSSKSSEDAVDVDKLPRAPSVRKIKLPGESDSD